MKLTSPAFAEGQTLPKQYTCEGENLSPPLRWEQIPPLTNSFVLMVEDLDAQPLPWTHWLVYNLPAQTHSLPVGSIPPAAQQGICNGGTYGYEGPCPKYFQGVHHYLFQIFALDTILDLPQEADKTMVAKAMVGHIRDRTTLTGTVPGQTGIQ